jgi:hypothetical protein
LLSYLVLCLFGEHCYLDKRDAFLSCWSHLGYVRSTSENLVIKSDILPVHIQYKPQGRVQSTMVLCQPACLLDILLTWKIENQERKYSLHLVSDDRGERLSTRDVTLIRSLSVPDISFVSHL